MSEPEHYDPILRMFGYAHLPERLQEVSKPFGVLANEMVLVLPHNSERTVALRKLLEANDAALKSAALPQPTAHNWGGDT